MTRRWTFPWTRPIWSFAGLLIAYFAFPVTWRDSPVLIALSLLLTVAGLSLLVWMMTQELRHKRRGEGHLNSQTLSMLLVLLVVSFSMAFFLLDRVDPDQIVGLRTRTDALYFTLSTMTTVGYGDVHAQGQLARGLVSALIVFNVVVVASLVGKHLRPS